MTKTTKTILIASLIVSVILSFGMNYAYAERNEIKTKQFDANKDYVSIPDDEFLERNDSKWMDQYRTDNQFAMKQNAVKGYVTDRTYEDNGWNNAMRKTVLTTHNFDVITGEAGNGFELVALVVALEKLQGDYDVTEPEKRFHDWIATKYAIPDNMNEIEDRIKELTNNANPKLVKQTIDAFNKQARHGNVPSELIQSDTYYWNITMLIAACDYDPECDSSFATEVRDNRLYEKDIPTDLPRTVSLVDRLIDYFLPLAYAWEDAQHYTFAYAEPWTCDYGTCKRSWSDNSVGTHNISAGSPPSGHGTSEEVDIAVTSCGDGSGTGSYNVVIADFDIGFVNHWSGFDAGYGCASDSTYGLVVDEQPDPMWGWVLSGTTDAYQE